MKIIPEINPSELSKKGRLLLVTGGAASGKSAFAEELSRSMPRDGKLFYVATMYWDRTDPETQERVLRHRRQRCGKGFETIERERRIAGLTDWLRPGDVMLLEDLSNLLANEMFPWWEESEGEPDLFRKKSRFREDGGAAFSQFIEEKIVKPVVEMYRSGISVVAVGSSITEEIPREMDYSTALYIKGLMQIQREIGQTADQVYEVVCGIPMSCKSG